MSISRRDFVVQGALTGLALGVLGNIAAADAETATTLPQAPLTGGFKSEEGVSLRWLEGISVKQYQGITWGASWPRGAVPATQSFSLNSKTGDLPLQTWPLATWPDGSLKWTGHATGPLPAETTDLKLELKAGGNLGKLVKIHETDDAISIDTGTVQASIPRKGSHLIRSIDRDGKPILRNARLVAMSQDRPSEWSHGAITTESFSSQVEKVVIEQKGPVRAVVKIEGKHSGANRAWLPFTIRLYFYAGSDAVRVMHTFIFDGDENRDFIRGLGLRFDVPMRDAMHDRHIRFTGEGSGLWAECVRNLSGLRRDPGQAVIDAQLAGKACPPIEQMAESVRTRLNLIPAWDGFSLHQSTADGFEIRKRTGGEGVSWIHADHGHRASGTGYIGGPSGGAAFGLRDFWQRHPTQLEVSGASTDQSQVTMWLWSPQSPAMDLRFYHDGMGMETHAQQLEGLNITYEDYEPGFGTPYGVARTSEMMIWALPATPSREQLVEMGQAVQHPPVLVCSPEHYHACKVFSPTWNLPDRSTPSKQRIEDQLDWSVDYYVKQVEERHWYGFWDYGDVMHTYDKDRHTWRYDVGGYAWDNSELSPDLWLWYSFLRTGDAKTFRLAEAMTRHTGEVDVYHIGKWAMLGSRHNVQHWGCSAKQLRISTAIYRRFYYYLTADERVGDLMRELVDADRTFITLDPIRKIRKEKYEPKEDALAVGLGTDWSALASAWLTEYERTGDEKCKTKLLNSMKSIGQLPNGFFTGGARYDLATGLYSAPSATEVGVSHLSALFGLPEICAELISLFGDPGFEKAWLNYCEFYNASEADRKKALGFSLKSAGQVNSHSRLTAYAAMKKKDPALAKRAWEEFFADDRRWAKERYSRATQRIEGPTVLNPINEAAWVSTNDTSQWALSAMQVISMVPDELEQASPSWTK